MESWRKVWRNGISPNLTLKQLKCLKHAIETDDPKLVQGSSTKPFGIENSQAIAEGGCVFSYCGWQTEQGMITVEDVDCYFSKMCVKVDMSMKSEGACRWFLNWYDELPREELKVLLLPEIERSIHIKSHKEVILSIDTPIMVQMNYA